MLKRLPKLVTQRQKEYAAIKTANELSKTVGRGSAGLFRFRRGPLEERRYAQTEEAKYCLVGYGKIMGFGIKNVERKSVIEIAAEVVEKTTKVFRKYAEQLNIPIKKTVAGLAKDLDAETKRILVKSAEKEGIPLPTFAGEVFISPSAEKIALKIWLHKCSKIPNADITQLGKKFNISTKSKTRQLLAREIWEKMPPMKPIEIQGTKIIKPIPLKRIRVWEYVPIRPEPSLELFKKIKK